MKVKVKSLIRAQLFVTPWIVACSKLLCPWDFQGKSTGVGCHFLLQGIFPIQGLNPGLSHCRQTLYRLSHQQSPTIQNIWTSLVAQKVKPLSTMPETWVRSLGWEDSLEKEMATHSSTLALKIPWTEEPGRLQSMGLWRVRHDWATSLFTFLL